MTSPYGVNIPGKILFLGGYSVTMPGNIGLSFAVYDFLGNGMFVEAKRAERARIISNTYSLDIFPSFSGFLARKVLVEYAYIVSKAYLDAENISTHEVSCEIFHNEMFGKGRNKTGLGSSAAVTVGIVSSFLRANDIYDALLVNKLSQIAYMLYSGKLSSGYDIATCAEGKTILYMRSALEVLSQLWKNKDIYSSYMSFARKIHDLVCREWNGMKIERIKLSSEIGIVFYNIKNEMTDTRLSLSRVNSAVSMSEANKNHYSMLLKRQDAYERLAVQSMIAKDYAALANSVRSAREVQRELQDWVSKETGEKFVIEDPKFTSFINLVEERVEGVICGRLPGAGGGDGIVFLVDIKKKDLDSVDQEIQLLARQRKISLSRILLKVV